MTIAAPDSENFLAGHPNETRDARSASPSLPRKRERGTKTRYTSFTIKYQAEGNSLSYSGYHIGWICSIIQVKVSSTK